MLHVTAVCTYHSMVVVLARSAALVRMSCVGTLNVHVSHMARGISTHVVGGDA